MGKRDGWLEMALATSLGLGIDSYFLARIYVFRDLVFSHRRVPIRWIRRVDHVVGSLTGGIDPAKEGGARVLGDASFLVGRTPRGLFRDLRLSAVLVLRWFGRWHFFRPGWGDSLFFDPLAAGTDVVHLCVFGVSTVPKPFWRSMIEEGKEGKAGGGGGKDPRFCSTIWIYQDILCSLCVSFQIGCL